MIGSRRHAAVAILLCVMLVAPSPAVAQERSFTSDVGLMVFTVRADRTDRFETVLQRLVDGLVAADRPGPTIGLRMLRSLQSTAEDQRLYFVLFEPVVRSHDYSLEQLFAASVPREGRALLEQLRSALASEPFVADLRVLHRVSPDDVMRARLQTALSRDGGILDVPAGPGQSGPGDRATLDRLQQPLWNVQGLEYRAVETTGGSWRFAWSVELANRSLVGPASADVSVDFRDQNGAVLYSAAARAAGVPVGESRRVAGEALIPSATASRVVTATVRIDSRP